MIDRVGNTFQSLQGVQANRSFQAAGRSSVFRQALEQELSSVESSQAPAQEDYYFPEQKPFAEPPAPARKTEAPAPQRLNVQPYVQLQPMINEVREIAETAGYIGVTSEDVLRAYHSGQSLLADYRV